MLNVILGLVLAVIVFVVLTAFITFQHSTLIFALIALAVFLAFAFGGGRFVNRP